MKTIVLDDATKEKYKHIYNVLNVLFVFWSLLLLAQFYKQPGYKSYYIDYVEVCAFALYVGYGIYQGYKMRFKGLYKYIGENLAPYYTWKSKTKKVLFFSALAVGAGLLVIRFFLPEQTVYYMQNILYVLGLSVPVIGITYWIIRHFRN